MRVEQVHREPPRPHQRANCPAPEDVGVPRSVGTKPSFEARGTGATLWSERHFYPSLSQASVSRLRALFSEGDDDRVLAHIRRRPLAARRDRRCGARCRYSSSAARSKPAAIMASAAKRLMKIPIPRPAVPKNVSGIELPATVPESLVVIALGALSTVFVLIRLISVPDEFFGWRGRGIGIFISLLASLIVIVAGLLRAGEEM